MEVHLLSSTEENYLKAIFELSERQGDLTTSTNELAAHVKLKPATVTETLKRLADKGLLVYEKYQPVRLTIIGKNMALKILRKQRIWNTYLLEKLGMGLDELVSHSEQLEHIQSDKLVDVLDELLGRPLFDPFGDPIPDAKGQMRGRCFKRLDQIQTGEACRITGFKNRSEIFIQYIRKLGLHIGNHLQVVEKEQFDSTLIVLKNGQTSLQLPHSLAQNIITSSAAECCAFEKQLAEPPCLTHLTKLAHKYQS